MWKIIWENIMLQEKALCSILF